MYEVNNLIKINQLIYFLFMSISLKFIYTNLVIFYEFRNTKNNKVRVKKIHVTDVGNRNKIKIILIKLPKVLN